MASVTDISRSRCSLPCCQKEGDGFKVCAKCKEIAYCCRDHQIADWPRHKKECSQIAATPVTPAKKESIKRSCWLSSCTKTENVGLQVCGRCNAARYCGYAHQRADWSNHQKQCQSLIAGTSERLLDQALKKTDPYENVNFHDYKLFKLPLDKKEAIEELRKRIQYRDTWIKSLESARDKGERVERLNNKFLPEKEEFLKGLQMAKDEQKAMLELLNKLEEASRN